MSAAPKAKKWTMRVSLATNDRVRRAASLSDRTLTDFVQQAAINEAERILADRTRFVLEPEQWERFNRLLDRPEQENPGLAKLFDRGSVFS